MAGGVPAVSGGEGVGREADHGGVGGEADVFVHAGDAEADVQGGSAGIKNECDVKKVVFVE